MNAVNYIKACKRICDANWPDCISCPAGGGDECYIKSTSAVWSPEQKEKVVSKWLIEHPVKTIQSELIKMFPTIDRDNDDIITICPANFDANMLTGRCSGSFCGDCRKEYYTKEIKDNE